ncbi:hypothetical protein KIPB_002131 [Kipferlia bialata]|uniref:Uncharacterized protein n=1 Tax=Kipferlia bialata TaxID=797122 RepID=A0A391NSD0_9EUKA|nr:hypothetical protein KIPB_002131 [Kipferlia bialata]|eukprot:g2131.t1
MRTPLVTSDAQTAAAFGVLDSDIHDLWTGKLETQVGGVLYKCNPSGVVEAQSLDTLEWESVYSGVLTGDCLLQHVIALDGCLYAVDDGLLPAESDQDNSDTRWCTFRKSMWRLELDKSSMGWKRISLEGLGRTWTYGPDWEWKGQFSHVTLMDSCIYVFVTTRHMDDEGEPELHNRSNAYFTYSPSNGLGPLCQAPDGELLSVHSIGQFLVAFRGSEGFSCGIFALDTISGEWQELPLPPLYPGSPIVGLYCWKEADLGMRLYTLSDDWCASLSGGIYTFARLSFGNGLQYPHIGDGEIQGDWRVVKYPMVFTNAADAERGGEYIDHVRDERYDAFHSYWETGFWGQGTASSAWRYYMEHSLCRRMPELADI